MKKKVGVLGATGMVGQRFIAMLADHPNFEIALLAASQKSEGKKYSECRWLMESNLPEFAAEMSVENVDNVEANCRSVDLVFSCLPGDIAQTTEEKYAERVPVVSKASAHRMDEDVPLIIPEVNSEHLALLEFQKNKRNYNGFISADPNCSTIQLAITLKPLMKYGIREVVVSTMQALSGAGHPGVPSMDIVDNVLPFISKEEEKMQSEPLKILGKFDKEYMKITPPKMQLSASCNRVNVSDGHTESVFLKLEEEVGIEELEKAFSSFKAIPQELSLPTAPEFPIIVRREEDRPQPRLDRMAGRGMSVAVGRVRKQGGWVKYSCLGHNTIRGAAGAGILHAELLNAKGYLK